MPNETTPTCCGTVKAGSDGWRTRHKQCSRPGVVERAGKHYCRTHDPEAKKARQDATLARWRAESDARALMSSREAAGREIVALARRATKQEASWDDVAEAVGKLEALYG